MDKFETMTEDFSVVHIAYRSCKVLLNVFESSSSGGAVNRLAAVQPDNRGLIPIEIEIFLSGAVPRPAFEFEFIV
jgi:hypothetical protein